MMSNSIDGNYDNHDIVNMFSDNYMSLYNSVPYNEDEMSRIKSIIDTKVNTCNTVYKIIVTDVTNAVTHLKLVNQMAVKVLNQTILLMEPTDYM